MAYNRWPSYSGSYSPITYLRGIPVDVTVILATAHVLAMLGVAILIALNKSDWTSQLVFNSDLNSSVVLTRDLHWVLQPAQEPIARVHSFLSYPFYHDIRASHIIFAIEIFVFVWFGREVERFVGHKAFFCLYGMLILGPPLLCMALKPFFGPVMLHGSAIAHFSIFVGFAVIYPNVQILFYGPTSKWVAWILLSVYTVFYLAQQAWIDMLQIWTSAAITYVSLRSCGVGGGLSWINNWDGWRRRRQESRIQQKLMKKSTQPVDPDARITDEAFLDELVPSDIIESIETPEPTVDEILEKISEHGMSSLSEEEQDILKNASRKLGGHRD